MTHEQTRDNEVEYSQRIEALEFENSLLLSENTRLKELAYTDALTGLGNLWALREHVDSLVENKEPFALFYIDIKNFKVINEVSGHDGGDAALVELSTLFNETLRSDDLLVRRTPEQHHAEDDHKATRKGGDEFVVVVRLNALSSDETDLRRDTNEVKPADLEAIKQRFIDKYAALPNVARFAEHVRPLLPDYSPGLHVGWTTHYPDRDDPLHPTSIADILKEADPKTQLPPQTEKLKTLPLLRFARYILRVVETTRTEDIAKLVDTDEPFHWQASTDA